jgi:hypothetical protein
VVAGTKAKLLERQLDGVRARSPKPWADDLKRH